MVCKPIIISQFGLFASLRQCCAVCFTKVCVAAFPLGHTSFCLSLACWAGAGGCTANPAVVSSSPGHSFPVALLIQKAGTAWQLWKMMDNIACLGFLKARKSCCADLVCYSGGGGASDIFFFFCADEHMINIFFVVLNCSITGACRRGRITKDCTNYLTSTSILSNSPVKVSLGFPLTPVEFKKPIFRCRIALDSRRQMVGCSRFLLFLSYWTAKDCSGFH